MMTFHDWLTERDGELAEALQEVWGSKYLTPLALAAGGLLGAGGAAHAASPADYTKLSPQQVQQGHRFHPYSYKSTGGMTKGIGGVKGFDKVPDYDSAYENFKAHGKTGLSAEHEPIFQKMLDQGKFK